MQGKDIKKSEKVKQGEQTRSLSVQPVGLLVVMGLVWNHLLYQNLLMESICRVDLGLPAATCENIVRNVSSVFKEQEREIQKVAAGIQAIISVLFSVLGVLLVLYIGPWSDAYGRRGPLLLSVSSILVGTIAMLIGYFSLGSLNGLSFALLTMLPFHLTGGIVTFCMVAYAHVADTTSKDQRTVWTGVLSGMIRAGAPLGYALGGLSMKKGVGVVPYLSFSLLLNVVSLLTVLFCVKNPTTPNANGTNSKGTIGLREFNPFSKLLETFKILFQQRKGRSALLLLVIVQVCYVAPMSGEGSMLYLFVRERFQWNAGDYGFFSMYNLLMSILGMGLSMFLLSKALKVSDPLLGLIAGLSQIGGSLLYAFSTSGNMMYYASALDMMNGTIGVVMRSMLSKLVEPDEVGKWFALIGVMDSLVPIPMAPAYALIYRSTLSTFTGAFFILSAGVTIPAELIFLYFMCNKKGITRNGSKAREDTQEDGTADPLNLDLLETNNNDYFKPNDPTTTN